MPTASTRIIARGFGTVSLMVITFVYFITFVLSTFELMGKDESMVDTKLIFGTGVYYVLILSIEAVLLITFFVAGHFDAMLSKGEEKAMFFYARYSWDAWSFFVMGVISWCLNLGMLAAFMIKFGWSADVNINAGTFTSEMVIRFRTNTIFLIASSLLMLHASITMIYAYIVKAYEIKSRTQIEQAIDLMRMSRKGESEREITDQ
jgi:hypothetical protein